MVKDKKKNILFIISSLSGGGAERVTVNLANALCDDYKVTICSLGKGKNEYLISDNVEVVYVPRLKRYSFCWFFNVLIRESFRITERLFPLFFKYPVVDLHIKNYIRKLKAELNPEITISMLEIPNALNSRIPGGIRIMSERNDPRRKSKHYYRIEEKSFRWGDKIVFQTETIKALFSSQIQRKGVVIENPVCVDEIEYKTDSKKIVSIGRLSSQKNQSLLIKAFVKFHDKHPDFTLTIFGEGEKRQDLEALIRSLGKESVIFLPGFVSDVHNQIADAKMFVLSSDYEGLSNALIEAMMMGIPVISTACNGSADVIIDGETGLLIPENDEKKLIEAMEQLAFDDDLCLKMSKHAKEYTQAFGTKKITEEWRVHFEDYPKTFK